MILHDVNNQIRLCKQCPDGVGEIEYGWGVPKQVMFIGQCPALTNKEGKQGNSNFDLYFLKLISSFGLNQSNIYFTNLVKTPQLNIRDLSRKTLHHCGDHLLYEYLAVRPKIVIALGKYAQRYFRVDNIEQLPHPAAIKYGVLTEEQWIDSLRRILRDNLLLTKENKYNG